MRRCVPCSVIYSKHGKLYNCPFIAHVEQKVEKISLVNQGYFMWSSTNICSFAPTLIKSQN